MLELSRGLCRVLGLGNFRIWVFGFRAWEAVGLLGFEGFQGFRVFVALGLGGCWVRGRGGLGFWGLGSGVRCWGLGVTVGLSKECFLHTMPLSQGGDSSSGLGLKEQHSST